MEIPLEPKVIVKSMMETWHGTKYHTYHGGVVICGDLSIDKNGVGYCRLVKGSGIQRNLADAICALISTNLLREQQRPRGGGSWNQPGVVYSVPP